MHDYNAALIRESNANYIRLDAHWPQLRRNGALDRYGIVNVCAAGDKEGDALGRQWQQRCEVMRDSMIYMA